MAERPLLEVDRLSRRFAVAGRRGSFLHAVDEVSLHIAVAVAKVAYANGLAQRTPPDDWVEDIRSRMFEPVYRDYV
jgi:malate dehydrogenase (oxaloacetate-decarboxylating)(NADP+)